MHKILDNQIKKFFGDSEQEYGKIKDLLIEIDSTYKEFDEELTILKHSDSSEISAMIEKKRTMESYFKNTPDTIFHIRSNGEIISCYGAIDETFNLDEKSFIGKNIFQMRDLFESEKFEEKVKICLLSREIILFQLNRPETHYAHHFEARLIPLKNDDMLLDLHNITMKKHAEDVIKETHRKLQDIIEFLPDATFVIDNSGKVIAWNRAIEKMTEVPKKEIIRKKNNEFSLPFYGDRRDTLINYIGEPIEKIESTYTDVKKIGETLTAEIFVPNLYMGKGAWVWVKVSPLYGKNEKIIGAIQTIRDISQRVRLEMITKGLYKITNEVSQAKSIGLDNLFKSIHEILKDILKVNNFYVALKDEKKDSISFPYFVDEVDPNPFLNEKIEREGRLLVQDVINSGLPLILKKDDIVKYAESCENFVGSIPQVWLAVPLKAGKKIIGAIVTQDYNNPEHFTDEDHNLLINVSEHIAMAVERKNANEALLKSEQKYRKIFENSIEGLFQTDIDGTLTNANPTFATIMGYESTDEMENILNINDFYNYKVDKERISRQLLKKNELKNYECLVKRKDGKKIWISVNLKKVVSNSGREFLEGTFDDITERKQAETARDNQKARFTQLFDNSPQAICLLNEDGDIVNVNREFKLLFGCDEKLDVMRNCFIPEDKIEEAQTLVKAVFNGESINEESSRRTSDGRIIPVSIIGYPFNFKGTIAGAFFIFNDISERKEYEKQITHQALHDSLTELPNRALFIERISRALARKKSNPNYAFAVMLVDLDRFKKINDSLGHMAGDELLVYIGHKLKDLLRPIDSLARLGGDEFGILLDSISDPKDVIAIAEKIRDSIADPLLVHGNQVAISASIGIVLRADEYEETDPILRDADISMYRSKELGKNRFKVFSKRLHDKVVSEVKVESELRRGIAEKEFETFFQPIFALNSMSLNGFEALIRWNHPKDGLVSPGRFIPVAEESGLIADIGRWVFEDACSTLSSWRKNFPAAKNVTLAVNLSARQFSQPDLLDMTREILDNTGFPAENLRLEVTETAIMDNLQIAIQKLKKIRKLGVKIAVDDFGIGYSSLSQLQALPVDVLKVDQSFVMRMEDDSESKAIVKMVIALAHTLGLDVVAEGVETEGQMNMLHAMNCNMVQGFLFSRPVNATAARSILHDNRLK